MITLQTEHLWCGIEGTILKIRTTFCNGALDALDATGRYVVRTRFVKREFFPGGRLGWSTLILKGPIRFGEDCEASQ